MKKGSVSTIVPVDSRGRAFSEDSAEVAPIKRGPADETIEKMISTGHLAFASLRK